jgi:hypothetical protein
MNLFFLLLLSILCVLLPFFFSCLEGMTNAYKTDDIDQLEQYTTSPQERKEIQEKIDKLLQEKKEKEKNNGNN